MNISAQIISSGAKLEDVIPVLRIYFTCSNILIHREFKLVAFFVFVAVCFTPCHGVFFECAYFNSNYEEPIGILYTCAATANYTDNSPTKVTAIRGNHTNPQASNSDVQVLEVRFNNDGIDRLPTGIAKFFPDLKMFSWNYARLKYLSQKDLKPFTNLVQVSFSSNMIKQLDGNVFKFNKKLQRIDLSFNAIQIIGNNFFDGLTELKSISFYGNLCNYNTVYYSMDIEQNKADLLWYCSPANVKQEVEACPAQCSDRFVKIESRVSEVETETHDLKAFLKIVYQLKQ